MLLMKTPPASIPPPPGPPPGLEKSQHGRPHRAVVESEGFPFGPGAPALEVSPRYGRSSSNTGHNSINPEVLKPHTGMTIRLTPELLDLLKRPGPRPKIELVLKSAGEGGPVLVVGGVAHNMNAHQMAAGSEVDILARTTQPGHGRGESSGRGEGGSSATAAGVVCGESGQAGLSVLASLHRKLIVQQVLTENKRAGFRARKDEIERRERESRKQTVRMEDKEEMRAAAEAIPVPIGQVPQHRHQHHQQDGGAGGGRRSAGAAAGGVGRGGCRSEQQQRRRRRRKDPLTAWVCGCYNGDGYTGHVADLRQFLKGIEFEHVLFRYHVKPGGTLDPDRRRFCVKFKTQAGRDLAVQRSGEALGPYCSWWNPEDVAVVLRGRDEDISGGGGGTGLNDLMVVLPQGRSIADVLEQVRARLPPDLTPALTAQQAGQDGNNKRQEAKRKRRRRRQLIDDDDNDDDEDGDTGGGNDTGDGAGAGVSYRCHRDRRRNSLEAYRRDMLRAALGAGLSEALALGPRRGAPAAAARVAGSDENNARRVATLAAGEAARELDAGLGAVAAAAEGKKGRDT